MDTVQSPCVRNCSLDEQKVCRGCFRKLEEIVDWHDADEKARRRILERVAVRRGMKEKTDDEAVTVPVC